MSHPQHEPLSKLSDVQLVERFELLRDGSPNRERLAVERELGRRVRAAKWLDLGGVRYRWDDDSDSFCRERIEPDMRTQNGRPGVPGGMRLGRAAVEGPARGLSSRCGHKLLDRGDRF